MAMKGQKFKKLDLNSKLKKPLKRIKFFLN